MRLASIKHGSCLSLFAVKNDNAVGGWSACLAMYLRLQLMGDLSIMTVGVPFCVDCEWATIHAKLEVLASDGEGLKDALDLKSYGGLAPCVIHPNVLKKIHICAIVGRTS